LDCIASWLAEGGPPTTRARKASLDDLTNRTIEKLGYQEGGHLSFPQNFATTFNEAVGYELEPPFDPYVNTINYLLSSNAIPHVGLVCYVGTKPYLANYTYRRLVAELLGVESGEDAVLPTLLYERTYENVLPYNITVVEFTIYVSDLRNQVAMFGIKDKGLIVPPQLGAESRTESNTLSADAKFLVLRKKSEAQNNLSLNSFACQLLPSPMMELATAAASVLRLARVEPPAVAAVAEVELTRAAITESTSSDLMMMMRSTMMMICCCHCCC
ncbi:hypothetical protein CISIN_1g047469mg, partial [Citrus sinensis]